MIQKSDIANLKILERKYIAQSDSKNRKFRTSDRKLHDSKI